MARPARPWYSKSKDTWMVTLGGRRYSLAKGKAGKQEAHKRFYELQIQLASNPSPDSPEQTVASVIDSYQTFAKQNLAASTLEVRL